MKDELRDRYELSTEVYGFRASRSTWRSGKKEKNPIRKAMPIREVISEYQNTKLFLSAAVTQRTLPCIQCSG